MDNVWFVGVKIGKSVLKKLEKVKTHAHMDKET
jgi:hypothetical protein